MAWRWTVIVCMVFVTSLYAAPATNPASSPTVDPDLRRAARILLNFADWSATHKAQSKGQAALEAARSIDPSPDRADAVDKALQSAANDTADAPATLERQHVAYESAAVILEAVSNKKHDPADDMQYQGYLLKAVELSPGNRITKLMAAMDKSAKADHVEAIEPLYLMLAFKEDFIPKLPTAVETKMAEKDLLAGEAQKVVGHYLEAKNRLAAAAYLTHLAAADPKGFEGDKYHDLIQPIVGKPFMGHLSTHPMISYISIPKNWTPTQKWPVIFCFAGAGMEYQNSCDSFRGAVGDRPYVVVSCVTLSNTNSVGNNFSSWYSKEIIAPYAGGKFDSMSVKLRLKFDLPGILATFKAVHDGFNTEEKMYISGHSGGGTPSYGMMIQYPDLIKASAPACANFFLGYMTPSGKAHGTPVQQLFGEKDGYNQSIFGGPGLLKQQAETIRPLTGMGYDLKPIVMVPGAGHSPLPKEAVAFFDSIRNAKQ